jgi:hypothetical protein
MLSSKAFDSVSTTVAKQSEHLTLSETADWLRCSIRTMQRLLETGSGPPAIRLSERRLIFRLSDLRSWLDGRTTACKDIAHKRRRGRPAKRIDTVVVP